MNNQDYLNALKKALAGMDRTARAEVLREIDSHISESGADSATLLARFGTPETLAQQYLEGETLRTPITKTVGGIGKKILMLVGGAVLLLVLLIVLLVYWFSPDDFNYADERASELISPQRSWLEVPVTGPLALSIDQARAVFYWHDAPTMRWSCKATVSPTTDEEGRYALRHNSCLVYLPPQPVTLLGQQADIVMVKPETEVALKLHQGQLRLAENGMSYRYNINAPRSKVADFKTDTAAALTISIEATESDLGFYAH